MLVTAQHLAKVLFLSEARISEMRKEGKIRYANAPRRLFNLEQACKDYDANTMPGFALRAAADKLDGWPIKAVVDELPVMPVIDGTQRPLH